MSDEARPVRKRRWRLLLVLIPALGVLCWYGSRAVGYVASHRAYVISGGSMAPTLLFGDRVVVTLQPGPPQRGEIWLIQGPNVNLIKRIVGLPGETIEVGGGRVLIDGEPLSEPYLDAPTAGSMAPVQLGPGQYFVMGDARGKSIDSRAFGPVHQGKFLGQAESRYWPSDRIGPLR